MKKITMVLIFASTCFAQKAMSLQDSLSRIIIVSNKILPAKQIIIKDSLGNIIDTVTIPSSIDMPTAKFKTSDIDTFSVGDSAKAVLQYKKKGSTKWQWLSETKIGISVGVDSTCKGCVIRVDGKIRPVFDRVYVDTTVVGE